MQFKVKFIADLFEVDGKRLEYPRLDTPVYTCNYQVDQKEKLDKAIENRVNKLRLKGVDVKRVDIEEISEVDYIQSQLEAIADLSVKIQMRFDKKADNEFGSLRANPDYVMSSLTHAIDTLGTFLTFSERLQKMEAEKELSKLDTDEGIVE